METAVKQDYNAEELALKDTQAKSEIFKLSFEYLLACVYAAYENDLREEGYTIDSIGDINKHTLLSIAKLVVYPFFIATANGHSKSLYNLFGEFKSFSYGPASMPALELLATNDLRFFELSSDLNSLRIRNSLGIRQLKTHIEDYSLQYSPELRFRDIRIQGDNATPEDQRLRPIYEAIASAADILQTRTRGQFFRASENAIVRAAKYTRAFNDALYNKEIKIITYNDLGNQRQRSLFLESQPS